MISNIVFVIWAWGASQGVEIAPTWQGRQWDWCDDQLTEWRVQGCPRPTRQQLVALQATADAKAAQVAADAKAAAATIDNADVRLRATVAELCAELEKIKAVIRTVHPATSNAIPARSAAEWGAAIKAKAQELQQ